jgi:hypothetical protein
MKALLFCLVIIVLSGSAHAQINFPDLSYQGTIHQKVGFTNFTVNYERPMQRGRALFGSFIPYGKPWRTGAGFHNTISFDQDVFMGGQKIEKGTYHLVTIPDPRSWKVILSTDSNAFSQNKPYEQAKEVVRIDAPVSVSKKHYEAVTIEIDIVNNDALFTVSWDHTSVSFTISTKTTQNIMSQIRKMMSSDVIDAAQYGDAANFIAYNLTSLGKSAKDTALILVDKAIAKAPEQWMYRAKRNIFWFSHDLDGYEKASDEWIAFLRKDQKEEHTAEIARIEEERIAMRRK